MAFWGVELKPGRPYNHQPDSSRGRLRITQVTLGYGTSTQKCLIQCNVGDKSPVLLCVLVPDKAESCNLDLEFEEAEDVIFSVIGGRGVFLTGYFKGRAPYVNGEDNTESYGEDIGNTESEESARNSDEDKYEDSFIDDEEEPEFFPTSSASHSNVDEEILEDEKCKKGKGGRKRLTKKYIVFSDDDNGSEQQKSLESQKDVPKLRTEDEDKVPISSFCKSTSNAVSQVEKKEKKRLREPGCEKTAGDSVRDMEIELKRINLEKKQLDKEGETRGVGAEDVEAPQSGAKQKKEKKQQNKKGKTLGVGADMQNETNTDKGGQVEQEKILGNDEIKLETGAKQKKEKKQQVKQEQTLEVGAEDVESLQNESKTDKRDQVLPLDNQEMNHNNDKIKIQSDPNQKKEKKQQDKKGETAGVGFANVETNADKRSQVLRVVAEHEKNPGNIKGTSEPQDELLAKGSKLKGKRKLRSEKEETLEIQGLNAPKEDRIKEDKSMANSIWQNLQVQNVAHSIDKADYVAEQNHLEEKTKKRRKKSKTLTSEDITTGQSHVATKVNTLATEHLGDKVDLSSSKLKTLSNGLVVEELETGKLDGKIATLGKKISIRYTAKQKDNGEIVDSSIDGAPHKFRLGDPDVMQGWNIGLEGMRVGEKRRLVIPPSMRNVGEGASGKIPLDSPLKINSDKIGL
ncbi:Nucleoplasmin-like domain, partial [Dillenia turbinata]